MDSLPLRLSFGAQVNASLDNRVLADILAVGYQWQRENDFKMDTLMQGAIIGGVRFK